MPIISITVSEDEQDKVRQRADEELRSISSYFRWLLSKDWMQAHPSTEQEEPEQAS